MATMNGVLSPPLHSEMMNSPASLSAKRKRDDNMEGQNHIHGNIDLKTIGSVAISAEETQALIRDLIDVLKTHDITPSILNRSLPERPSSSGPQAKRQKSEDAADTKASIMTRFSENAYNSVEEVLEDIDIAVSDIKEKLQLPNGAARNQYIPVPPNQSEITVKVSAFKQNAQELVRRELAAAAKKVPGAQSNGKPPSYSISNGSGANTITELNAGQSDGKMVLTLFGTAPVPKQLFSGLQIPTKIPGENKEILQTLREAGLPNGISTTQIIPLQATGLIEEKKRTPTLGELFPTPPNVPALKVPSQSKIANTKSSTVGWYQPSIRDSLPRTASYFRQPISTGQWLDYSNAATSSQGSKKKQRDRALSLSASKAPQIEAEPAESEAAKLEALFRGAYTSFAPTKDDAAAVVPTGVVDRLWWQKFGEKSFDRFVANAELLSIDADTAQVEEQIAEDVDELKLFEDAIAALEQDPIDPSLFALETKVEKSAEEKDVDEILKGISELLETLNSFQRIRHVNLNGSSRPSGLLSAPDTSSTGTPSKPSEQEQATYEIIRSQLTLMIASLPPYAVAKLNSDKLADLCISTKIEVQTNNYHGVMEEDEAATRAKVAALSAASSTPRVPQPASVHRSSTSNLYGNQYSASRSGPPPAQQYYGSTSGPIRPPSSMQRPQQPAPSPYQQNPRPVANNLYRPTTYGTPTYPHQNPRPVQQQYPSANQLPYHQSPAAQPYMRPPTQNYQQMPQSTPSMPTNGRYTGQPYAHQSQALQNGMSYGYNNAVANTPQQSSPQKSIYSPQLPPAQPQPQPRPYSTPTPPIAQDRRQYFQNPIPQSPMMNGTPSLAPQPQPQYPHQQGGLNYNSSFLTHEQQSSLLERQRAQLAAHQANTQQVARSAAQAAMGPSTATSQVNGGNPVPAGL